MLTLQRCQLALQLQHPHLDQGVLLHDTCSPDEWPHKKKKAATCAMSPNSLLQPNQSVLLQATLCGASVSAPPTQGSNRLIPRWAQPLAGSGWRYWQGKLLLGRGTGSLPDRLPPLPRTCGPTPSPLARSWSAQGCTQYKNQLLGRAPVAIHACCHITLAIAHQASLAHQRGDGLCTEWCMCARPPGHPAASRRRTACPSQSCPAVQAAPRHTRHG